MYLTPRDMLKFGVTCLNKGPWKGNKILPDEWIAKSSGIYNNNKSLDRLRIAERMVAFIHGGLVN